MPFIVKINEDRVWLGHFEQGGEGKMEAGRRW